MNKKRLPILSIILYILAVLLMVFGIWSLRNSANYISLMIKQGQLTFSGNEFDIINFVINNCIQYIVFAIILFTLGWISHKLQFIVSNVSNDEVIEDTELYEEISEDSAPEDIAVDYAVEEESSEE